MTARGWRNARSSTVSSCGYRLGWMNSWSQSDLEGQVDHGLDRVHAPLGGRCRPPTGWGAGPGGRPGCPRSRAAGPGRRRRSTRRSRRAWPRRPGARASSGSRRALQLLVLRERPEVVPGRQQVEGQPGLERQQHRDAPAVGLGDTAGPPAAGGVVEEVEQVVGVAGRHQAEGDRAPGSRRPAPACGRATGPAPRGRAADMPPSAPSKMPAPRSPMTATSWTTSSHAASREATGRSSEVSWCSLREVENPMAPARSRASPAGAFMRARSSSVASSSKARSPMAQVRSAEWPMLAAKLMPLGRRSTASRYSGKVSKLQSMPCGQRGRVDVLGPLEVAHHQVPLVAAGPGPG